ncbi:hypothetical protein OPQ81_005265 [Rhizoctonia solani]|nr:hypothetical protein OPQ81_005265 [Rhizoctonia solani]
MEALIGDFLTGQEKSAVYTPRGFNPNLNKSRAQNPNDRQQTCAFSHSGAFRLAGVPGSIPLGGHPIPPPDVIGWSNGVRKPPTNTGFWEPRRSNVNRTQGGLRSPQLKQT